MIALLVSSKASELLLEPVPFHTFTDAAGKRTQACITVRKVIMERFDENREAPSMSGASRRGHSLPAPASKRSGWRFWPRDDIYWVLSVCKLERKKEKKKRLHHLVYLNDRANEISDRKLIQDTRPEAFFRT